MNPWLKLALYLSALLVTARVLGLTPSVPDDEHVAGEQQTCEVLFVGPSYVKAQVLPELIDEETRRLGRPLRTCKFGRTSLSGYEQKWDLRRLLSQPWPRLKLVVVDVTLGDNSEIREENRWKPRVLRWHDWRQLTWFFERTSFDFESLAPVMQALDHTEHFVARTLRVSQGAFFLHDQGTPPAADGTTTWQKWRRQESKLSATAKEKRHRKKLDKLLTRKFERGKGASRTGWALELLDELRSLGYAGHVLIAPVWYPVRVRRQDISAVNSVVYDFNDPITYPSLYTQAARGRTHHVSAKGRKIYSKLLAHELVRFFERKEGEGK